MDPYIMIDRSMLAQLCPFAYVARIYRDPQWKYYIAKFINIVTISFGKT